MVEWFLVMIPAVRKCIDVIVCFCMKAFNINLNLFWIKVLYLISEKILKKKMMPRGKFERPLPEIYPEIFDENYNMRPCKEVKCRKYGGYLVSLNYGQFYESVFAQKWPVHLWNRSSDRQLSEYFKGFLGLFLPRRNWWDLWRFKNWRFLQIHRFNNHENE